MSRVRGSDLERTQGVQDSAPHERIADVHTALQNTYSRVPRDQDTAAQTQIGNVTDTVVQIQHVQTTTHKQ